MPNQLSPETTSDNIRRGAVLVDIRQPEEFLREHIAGAINLPLSNLATSALPCDKVIIFSCKTGHRTLVNQQTLENFAGGDISILQGGLEGWKAAGLPTVFDKRQPMEMMRQVQIAAGSLALLGTVLGFAINPAFYGLSAAVGAGLMFSGISGTCAMASMLKILPWNRIAA